MVSPAALRFGRYCAVGVSTLAIDLGLLALLTQVWGVRLSIATPAAFLVAVSINYGISRLLVFRGTRRRLDHGYALFIAFALLGAAATTAITTGLAALGLYYLAARIAAAGVIGVANYLANLHLNFQMGARRPSIGPPESAPAEP